MPDFISVSVKAPDSCPPLAATIHARPKSDDEFFAILSALPPEGEPHVVSDWIVADLGGDHTMHLHAPQSVEAAMRLTSPATEYVRGAMESYRETHAEEAEDEQRTAAEDDPRGVADR